MLIVGDHLGKSAFLFSINFRLHQLPTIHRRLSVINENQAWSHFVLLWSPTIAFAECRWPMGIGLYLWKTYRKPTQLSSQFKLKSVEIQVRFKQAPVNKTSFISLNRRERWLPFRKSTLPNCTQPTTTVFSKTTLTWTINFHEHLTDTCPFMASKHNFFSTYSKSILDIPY